MRDVTVATKYDNWAHYRNQLTNACGSSKAVDFIVVVDSTLWLIEAKDYSENPRIKSIEFSQELAQKARDTLMGIMCTRAYASDRDEKRLARDVMKFSKIRFALHLETRKHRNRLFPQPTNAADLSLKLRQQLRFVDPHPIVFSRNSMHPAVPMVVELE